MSNLAHGPHDLIICSKKKCWCLFAEGQNEILKHVEKQGLPVPKLVKNLKGENMSLEKIYHSENMSGNYQYVFTISLPSLKSSSAYPNL